MKTTFQHLKSVAKKLFITSFILKCAIFTIEHPGLIVSTATGTAVTFNVNAQPTTTNNGGRQEKAFVRWSGDSIANFWTTDIPLRILGVNNDNAWTAGVNGGVNSKATRGIRTDSLILYIKSVLNAYYLKAGDTTGGNPVMTWNQAELTVAAIASEMDGDSLAMVDSFTVFRGLLNALVIPAAQVPSDWSASSGVTRILNKPTLGTAAASNTTDFATAAQGISAASALQPTGNGSALTGITQSQISGLTALLASLIADSVYQRTLIDANSTIISSLVSDSVYQASLLSTYNTRINALIADTVYLSGLISSNTTKITALISDSVFQAALIAGNTTKINALIADTVYLASLIAANTSKINSLVSDSVYQAAQIAALQANAIPSQTGNAGRDLRSNGSVVSWGKRQETYSGSSNASGDYIVTFSTAYSVAPNIQANIIGGTTEQQSRVVSVSTTGFTVNAFQRATVLSLALSTATNPVNGALIHVLITEF